MDKDTLKQDIETKEKELENLKAQILASNKQKDKDDLEIQKTKLEEEIKTLQDKLYELEELEKISAVNSTKDETDKLKNDVEVDSNQTYELIKGSKMYNKLLSVLGNDESKVETFAFDIDKVVRKFLDQELEGFSNKIKNAMCVGIQFAMMETLIEQGAEGSANFFEAFSRTKTDNSGKAFEGLYKAFGKLGSANKFYTLANKVQNISRYIADNKNKITAVQNIPELMNPYQFKLLLDKPVWSNQVQIDKLDISTVLTLNSSTEVDIHADDDKLKEIVNKDVMEGVITEKTIAAIQKSLKTADKLLDTRDKFSSKATDLIDKISGFLDINIPFLGNLGELVGVEFPTDVLGKRKDGGLINFVLGVFGFRGGLKGLHRKYIQEKLDELDIDNTFITAAYEDFQKNADATITNDSADSTWKKCALSASDAATETAMKAKIPADYSTLKKSIISNLNENVTLNAAIVGKFAPGAIITEGDKSVVDTSKITEADIDTYLQYIIPKLAADDFITSDKVDKDAFVLAVIGGLTGDKYFIEGVNLGMLTISDFKNATDNSAAGDKFSYEDIDETDAELVRLSAGPNENYSENAKFKQYLHTLEGKNHLPYGIMLNLMKAESGGQLYNTDGTTIIGSTAGAKGLFQFMPATAETYIVKLGYQKTDYEKIFTNPIIGAKACAQFLKDRKDAGDDTVNILAHYNSGPNILSGVKIDKRTFKKLPKETQKYVLKIGYLMLEYIGKSTIITTAQQEDPSLISETTLENFLTAVNSIPVASEASSEDIEELTAENYKANTVFVGDSLTVGYTNYPTKNAATKEITGYRSLGSKMGGKLTAWMDEHFSEAIESTPKPKTIVLLGGVNDLCNFSLTNVSGGTHRNAQAMADEIFKNIKSMSDKAEAAGIKFIVGTILPFDGFLEKQTYASQKTIVHDALKLINDKIKTTWPNNYIDYYSEFNDSSNMGHLLSKYDGGDGIHLSIAGYKKMQELAFAKRKEVNTSAVA